MTDASSTSLHRPASRAARLNAIEQALRMHVVTSQSQLSDILAIQGIEVTQATLSRDLDEMNATKTRMPDGTVAYTIDEHSPEYAEDNVLDERTQQHMTRVLSGLVLMVARAQNLVVVHTSSGAAQYVASVIDRGEIRGILGTIAGDDTVLVICKDEDLAEQRAEWLLEISSTHASSHVDENAA